MDRNTTPNNLNFTSVIAIVVSLISLWITHSFYNHQTDIQLQQTKLAIINTELQKEQTETNKRLLQLQEKMHNMGIKLSGRFEIGEKDTWLVIENKGDTTAYVGDIFVDNIPIASHPLFNTPPPEQNEYCGHIRAIYPNTNTRFLTVALPEKGTITTRSKSQGDALLPHQIYISIFYDDDHDFVNDMSRYDFNQLFAIEFAEVVVFPKNYNLELSKVKSTKTQMQGIRSATKRPKRSKDDRDCLKGFGASQFLGQ